MRNSSRKQQPDLTPLQMTAETPHQRLVGAAREMFCRDGIHATGIDRILAAAGVSKMTLYSRFGSKEALVREVLAQEGAEWRAGFFQQINDFATDPHERLRHVIAAMGTWFRGERFYGCAFMNAMGEHSKGEPWLRALAAEHQTEIVQFLSKEAEAAGCADPKMLARQIMLLIDGAIAAYLVSGDIAVLDISERNLKAILAIECAPSELPI